MTVVEGGGEEGITADKTKWSIFTVRCSEIVDFAPPQTTANRCGEALQNF